MNYEEREKKTVELLDLIVDMLPEVGEDIDIDRDYGFRWGDNGDLIMCRTEEEANILANFLRQLGDVNGSSRFTTGQNGPEEEYPGYYYVSLI